MAVVVGEAVASENKTFGVSKPKNWPAILPLGSCHVSLGVIEAENQGLARGINVNNQAHSTREIVQLLLHCADMSDVPAAYTHLCFSSPRYLSKEGLQGTDVLCVEICNPYPILMGDIVLNKNLLMGSLADHIKDGGDAASAATYRWFLGLTKKSELIHKETKENLLKHIPKGDELSELYRDIVQYASITEMTSAEMRGDIGIVTEIIDRPLVGLTHTMRYFPDGRPISWPGWLYNEVNRLFEDINMPMVNPSRLVAERGVKFALNADLTHYSEQFNQLLGRVLADAALRAMETYGSCGNSAAHY